MKDEELVKVAMRHVLKDHALRLLLQADAHQADNVWVPQVSHQLRFSDEVLSGLLVCTRLEGLDGHEAGDRPDRAVPGQLPLVHLAEGALAQLLEEANGGEREFHCSSFCLLLLLPRRQQGTHLHVGLTAAVLTSKVSEENVIKLCDIEEDCSPAKRPSWHYEGFCRGCLPPHATEANGESEDSKG